METVSKTLDLLRESDSIFTVKKLKYGGYEVLVRDEDHFAALRHICDFETEDEAQLWISENQHQL